MRERILDVATEHFVRNGYDGTSMREIAADCGITKAALYYHYTGKAELLGAVVDSYLDEVGQVTIESDGPGGRAERLRRLVHGLFALPAWRRAIIRLAMHDLGKLDPGQQDGFGQAYRERFLGPLHQLFADGAAAGEFVAKDPELLVRLLLGILYPLFVPPLPGVSPVSAADVDDLLEVFLDGATPRPAC